MKGRGPALLLVATVGVGTPGVSAARAPHHAVVDATRAALATAQSTHATLVRRQADQQAALKARQAARDAAATQARTAALKAADLSRQSVAANAQLQQTEQDTADLADRIAALRTEDATLNRQITQDAASLRPFLPLVERLSLYPADTLLAAPVEPRRAISGLMLMRGLSQSLERRAEAMRARQDRVTTIRATLDAQNRQLETLTIRQTEQRDAVAGQARAALAAQQASNRAARAADSALEDATRRAASLQDAIGRLESAESDLEARLQAQARRAAAAHDETQAKAAQARADALSAGPGIVAHGPGGNAPVAGTVATAWGAATESGPASGITYAAVSGANVRAPCGGRVDFAGLFRSYGQMIILDCGQHYRFVVAGLGSLAVTTGQRLAKGASVGAMPSGARTGLFLQLRHGGAAVDPAPFL